MLTPVICLALTTFLAVPSDTAPSVADLYHNINRNWNATKADKLKRELLLNYDKFTRPNQNENATVVYFDPSINHIEMDEERGIISVHCWVKMTWVDDKLKWNKDEYNLTELHLADHEIWQPDIIPYNSAAGTAIDLFGNTNAIVTHEGLVVWAPPAILQVFCDLKFRKWPFDTQECPIKVGSWTYSSVQIDLKYSDIEPHFENLLVNPEWRFLSIKRQRNSYLYPCCPEPYLDLVFTVSIARQSATYSALIVTPITAIVLITLTTFWLPAGSRDKLFLGGTTAVIISLFLIYFSQKVAKMAGETPLIVSFYVNSLFLVAVSILISVAVINLASSPKTSPLPWAIKNLLTGWLGTVLLLQGLSSQVLPLQNSLPKSDSDEETSDHRPLSQDAPERQEGGSNAYAAQKDWWLLATAIDRTCFLVYCLLFICFAIAYSV